MIGIEQLLGGAAASPGEVAQVLHATTLFTNTLIERKGAKTALVTTNGFRDAVEIGREHRYDMYDLAIRRSPPLAARPLRFEIDERILADGSILKPLKEEDAILVAHELRKHEVEAVAICLINSYVNGIHERQFAEIIRRELPHIGLTASHELVPEIGEFDRSSTALANVYVQRIAEQYLARLQCRLEQRGIGGRLLVMQSNGGLCDDVVRTLACGLDKIDWSRVRALINEMCLEAAKLVRQAVPPGMIRYRCFVDMRYHKQGATIRAEMGADNVGPHLAAALEAGFEETYRRIYGHLIPDAAIETVAWRVAALGPPSHIDLPRAADANDVQSALCSRRPVYLPDTQRLADVPVYDRRKLPQGGSFTGPAIIEERESTAAILGPAELSVDRAMVRKGRLITPPVISSILESVTRDTMLKLAAEELGLEVAERDIDRSELCIAEELFFMGTGWEILPILEVDGLAVGGGEMGPVTRELDRCYTDLVRGRLADTRGWLTSVHAAGIRVDPERSPV